MLLATDGTAPCQVIAPGAAPPQAAIWFDLFDPTDDERAAVETATGLRVPLQAEIVEIESSSRLRLEGDGIYLSTPATSPGEGGARIVTALGIVLSSRHILTLRFARLPAFDRYGGSLGRTSHPHCATGVFIGLMEAVVDRLADLLEQVGADLDVLSKRIFHADGAPVPKPRQEDAALRATLRRIGAAGDLISNLRDSLLGLGRIIPYAADAASGWMPPELRPRLVTLRQDITSLNDYDSQLINKVQFLLDATLGFLNIEQNNGIKVLTVVSIVGIPPTLIASIYGMNFKNMPELQWTYGYEYGLGMILLSVVLPLLLFKLKGWL